jgi:hypothetical protein
VRHRASAQRAGAEGRGTQRGRLTRGPGRTGERGGRQVGPEEEEKEKCNGSTYKIKYMHFPSSKNHQIFMEAILNHQEHNSTTRAQKSIMD